MEVFPGISMDPDVRFGKPCLSGTRIDVATVVGALAAGESTETVAHEYSLTRRRSTLRSPMRHISRLTFHRRWSSLVKILLDENFPGTRPHPSSRRLGL
jgi:hypothetical protein